MTIPPNELLHAWQQNPIRGLPTSTAPSPSTRNPSYLDSREVVVLLPPLSQEVQQQLAEHAIYGLTQSWTIPSVTSPLTQKEIEFLTSHTLNDLVTRPSPPQENSFVEKFVISFLGALATQITVDFLQGLISPEPNELRNETDSASKEAEPIKGSKTTKSADPNTLNDQTKAQTNDPLKGEEKTHVEGKELSNETKHDDISPVEKQTNTNHKPPRIIQKAGKVVFKLAYKAGKSAIQEKVMKAYKDTADEVAIAAAKKAGHMSDSTIKGFRHDVRQKYLEEGKEVSQFVGHTIDALAKTGNILYKTYESGESLRTVILDDLKDQTVSYFIHKGSKLVLSASPYVLSKAVTNGFMAGFKEVLEPPPSLNIGEDTAISRIHIQKQYNNFMQQLDPLSQNPAPTLSFPQDSLSPPGPRFERPDLYQGKDPGPHCLVM